MGPTKGDQYNHLRTVSVPEGKSYLTTRNAKTDSKLKQIEGLLFVAVSIGKEQQGLFSCGLDNVQNIRVSVTQPDEEVTA